MLKRFSPVIITLILFSGYLSAQSISIKSFTDTTDYNIGDYISYTVEVTYDKNIVILTPDIKKKISNVDVLAEQPPKTETRDGKVVTTYNFTFSRYDSADVVIPPVPVKYGEGLDTAGRVAFLLEKDTTLSVVYSNETKFTVHSLKINAEEDIKDIKPPLTLPPDWRIIALWILGGLLVIYAAYYFYIRYKRSREVKPAKQKLVIIPPHIKALEALKHLEGEQLWQKGEIKAYHSRITEIIRNYFEERFNLPALELSSTEILYHLKRQPGAGDITGLTADFLNNADLVKFAKYIPLNSVNEAMMKQAYEIVNITAQVSEIKEAENV